MHKPKFVVSDLGPVLYKQNFSFFIIFLAMTKQNIKM